MEVYPHKRRFSGDTISVVHVIKIDNVELIAILETIDVTINKITLCKAVTIGKILLTFH